MQQASRNALALPSLEDFLPVERVPPCRRGEAFPEPGIQCGLHLVGIARGKGTNIALDARAPGDEGAGKPARPEADGGILRRFAANLSILHPLAGGNVEAS